MCMCEDSILCHELSMRTRGKGQTCAGALLAVLAAAAPAAIAIM